MFVPGKNPVKKPGWKAHKPMLLTYVADRHMAIEFTVSWLHNSYAVYLAASCRRGQPGAVTGHRSYTHCSDRLLDTSNLAGVILTGAVSLYQGQKRLM